MIFLPDVVVQLLIQYRYYLIFPIMVIEGPIITVIAAFLSSLGYFNIFVVYALSVLGDLMGDSMYYAIGRWGRRGFIDRWGHYIGITKKRISRLERHFRDHSGKTLILGKLSQGLSAAVIMSAGASDMSFLKFTKFNLAATFPKSLMMVLLGYYFGAAYSRINNVLDFTTWATIGIALLITFIYITIRRMGRKYGVDISN